MTDKVPQDRQDLENHLAEHIGFLKLSANAYDLGQSGEAKRLAVSLRVLFHDTKNSHSLLGQLQRLHGSVLSTCIPHDPGNIATHGGLVMVAARGAKSQFVAMLDEAPYRRWLPFTDWWNEHVFVDNRRSVLSRRDLILAVANQDGGAHVDKSLDAPYAHLSRHNSMGWVWTNATERHPIPDPERAAIRQITHEVLRTLDASYSKKPTQEAEIFFGGAMVHNSPTTPPLPVPTKVRRNDICPCGTGKKFKKCHGAAASNPTR